MCGLSCDIFALQSSKSSSTFIFERNVVMTLKHLAKIFFALLMLVSAGAGAQENSNQPFVIGPGQGPVVGPRAPVTPETWPVNVDGLLAMSKIVLKENPRTGLREFPVVLDLKSMKMFFEDNMSTRTSCYNQPLRLNIIEKSGMSVTFQATPLAPWCEVPTITFNIEARKMLWFDKPSQNGLSRGGGPFRFHPPQFFP